MIGFLKEYLKDKKVLILGFGREGRSTFDIVRKNASVSKLAVADKMATDLPADVTLITGENYLDCLEDFDIVIKSPGVGLPKKATEYKCCITSQIELFLKVYSKQCVGITGTKGKSTTASLLYHVLNSAGEDCVFAGNIGVPVFDIVDQITKNTKIVLELSCHQLENITASPAVSVLLNLYEDHLDRYGTFEVYADAKKNIYRCQTAEDILFCNTEFLPRQGDCKAEVRGIDPEDLPDIGEIETKLKGIHNRYNIVVVWEICKLLKVSEEKIAKGIAGFNPLAHRLEFVGNVCGIDYYDDSISTTAESTISAIKSVENIGTILIGGMERGIDYEGLVAFLLTCNIDNVIFMYDSGKRIYDRVLELAEGKELKTRFVYIPDLKSAVCKAREITASGKACVLSPAAASYGVFKNFEDRGDQFRKFATELK